MLKARYQVKLQHYKKGSNGATPYGFSTKLKATIFAAGYQAALNDVGKGYLYVSVWDNGNYFKNEGDNHTLHKHECVANSEQLKEIAAREY